MEQGNSQPALDDPPIAEICQRIVAAIQPEKVLLFGSYAWGTPNPDSDLDLFVIVASSDQPAYRRARSVYRCLRGITFPIDVESSRLLLGSVPQLLDTGVYYCHRPG